MDYGCMDTRDRSLPLRWRASRLCGKGLGRGTALRQPHLCLHPHHVSKDGESTQESCGAAKKLTSVTPSPPSCQPHHFSQCCDTKTLRDLSRTWCLSTKYLPHVPQYPVFAHLQECISSLPPLTAPILHHPLCLHSLLHPTLTMAPQTGRRRSLDKAQRTLQKGSWGCDTNWLFGLHTTVLCLRCSIGALPHLLAPASYSKLPHTFGRDLWLVFSSPSKLLGDSNSLLIASSGPRVSVAAAVFTNRVIKTGKCLSLPTQPQIQAEKVVIWVGSNYCGKWAQQRPHCCLQSWV